MTSVRVVHTFHNSLCLKLKINYKIANQWEVRTYVCTLEVTHVTELKLKCSECFRCAGICNLAICYGNPAWKLPLIDVPTTNVGLQVCSDNRNMAAKHNTTLSPMVLVHSMNYICSLKRMCVHMSAVHLLTLGMPVTASYITPHRVRASCEGVG